MRLLAVDIVSPSLFVFLLFMFCRTVLNVVFLCLVHVLKKWNIVFSIVFVVFVFELLSMYFVLFGAYST